MENRLTNNQNPYQIRRFPYFIRIISAILIVAFLAYDISWAYPDNLQIELRTTRNDFKLAFDIKYNVDKARNIANLIDRYPPRSLDDIAQWKGASDLDFSDVVFDEVKDRKDKLVEILIKLGKGDIVLRY
ncbi:MAG: hypothetical protein HZC19_01830, partial [Candidatus Omnitrophica bacterium]|nr:hypothetical protein [Candidatus Omnitrophota bacterium]